VLMTVFVDPLMTCIPTPTWRWVKSCHMFAADPIELHAFASKLGLHRAWFQNRPGHVPHYDLNASKRRKAIRLGAKSVSGKHAVNLWRLWGYRRRGQ
jgi:hypothetical protein